MFDCVFVILKATISERSPNYAEMFTDAGLMEELANVIRESNDSDLIVCVDDCFEFVMKCVC